MMPAETKYIARRAGLFASLMQATELAGFRLEPLAPASLRDVYFDTPAGDLLRQGYSLRVREQGRTAQAQLRALRAPAGARAREADAALEPFSPGDDLPALPTGPLREMLDLLVGDEPLRALLRLRQDRSPRVVYDGTRLVGVISLDVVGYELPTRLHVANEIEIELAGTGAQGDLHRLDPVLRASGLEATSHSKFERGVLRLQSGDEVPMLLLPDERHDLERMLEAHDPSLRRRARVVLLAARGLGADVVSARAGLSPARVRHWVGRFRAGRLPALREPEVEAPDFAPAAGSTPPPAYRVSEIVSRGVPTAAVFRPEHFDPETGAGFSVERSREEGAPADPRGDGAAGDGAAGRPPWGISPPEWLDPLPLTVIPVEPAQRLEEVHRDEAPPDEVPIPESPEARDSPTNVAETASEGVEVAPAPDEEAPERAEARPRRGGSRPRPAADTPVLHAAAEILRHHTDSFIDAADELLERGEAPAARRALLAAHRVRLALETFEEFLPERPVQRLHDRLRGVARALDALVDVDGAVAQLGAAPAGDARQRLDRRRAEALRRARTRLTATRHQQWCRRMERLLALLDARRESGDLEADFFRAPPDDYLRRDEPRPARIRLRHVLASTIWRRYEEVRAYDSVMPSEDAALTRPLAVRCAALGFVLGLAADCAPGDVRSASRVADELEAALGARHRRAVSLSLLGDAAPALDSGAEAVASAWERIVSEEYRSVLAAVAGSV